MSSYIKINENGLYLVFEVSDEKDLRLLNFSSFKTDDYKNLPEIIKKEYRFIQLQFTGENKIIHNGTKHVGSIPGSRLKFISMDDTNNDYGRFITINMIDEKSNVKLSSFIQFYTSISIIRTWNSITNCGVENVGVEYLSSAIISGFDRFGLKNRDEKIRLHLPHNSWCNEALWQEYSLAELGFHSNEEDSSKKISIANTGSWSTSLYGTMGFIENKEIGMGIIWQIEHQGSWYFELSANNNVLYFQLSGPTEQENHWWKNLKVGESFVSVPVAVGAVNGDIQTGIQELTKYRRKIRRPNSDNLNLPVIFNDYMNCLFGDPTTEKLLPLIDAAHDAGAEYFCIDCGWYSAGEWWDGVGEWLPSKERFPKGIIEVTNYIKYKGMIPGLWLELEVIGINSPIAKKFPDQCFFMSHGKRVMSRSRYQLDYRNEEVKKFATNVIDRLVNEYGVGYIKMDYNINIGIGTDYNADSHGEGLLQHNRAYLNWIDSIFIKYPDLVIENCGSGGMREDYALLSRCSIQSSSDQTDYKKNGIIAASSASMVTPEQCAVWNYPLTDGNKEEVIFNMVNSILLRIHLSGHLVNMEKERFELIKEGLIYYKKIRHHLCTGLPFWPLGIPNINNDWMCFGIKDKDIYLLSVWRMNSERDIISLIIPELIGKDVDVCVGYPKNEPVEFLWNKNIGSVSVLLKQDYSARLFHISIK